MCNALTVAGFLKIEPNNGNYYDMSKIMYLLQTKYAGLYFQLLYRRVTENKLPL